ncbi:MAG: 2-succinyl-6-hydroxy-2,4-cyclohexadiene-1-carboxylate synthase, partial [Raoultibacter sp.]
QWGDPAKPPVVLLHGFAQSTESWETVAPLLAERRFVVAFDFVGHGRSDKPNDPSVYEMSEVIEALSAFLHDQFTAKVALVGYSMGGRVALSYASLEPSRLSALVAESAGLGPKSGQQHSAMQRRDADLIERLLSSDIESFTSYWESLPLFETQKRLPEELRERVRQGRLANDPRALAYTVRGTGQHSMVDLMEHIKRFPMPILYIAGILDRKYLKIAENLQYEKNVTCVLLNTGHNTHLEDPEAFARQV